uniref:Uncharacterized protein n=1 Tax=Romanomermis culicivorax TaxID=13658 RepID=A0A915IS65_ROMCU
MQQQQQQQQVDHYSILPSGKQ